MVDRNVGLPPTAGRESAGLAEEGAVLVSSNDADRLEKDLRYAILSGTMERGKRLMSLRDIAGKYGISYGRVHRVVRKLQSEGLLVSRRGGGTFVADRASERAALRPTDNGDAPSALVVAPRFYWSLGEGSWTTEFVRGLESYLAERGATVRVMFEEEFTGASSDRFAEQAEARTIIFFGARQEWLERSLRALAEDGVNAILVSGDPRMSDWALTVDFDGRSGIQKATDHLLRLGHTSVYLASWGWPDEAMREDWWVAEREEAYSRAVNEAGIDPRIIKVPYPGDGAPEGSDVPVLRLLDGAEPRPTAVVCVNDALARCVVAECELLGLEVPGDLSVVGFDDDPWAVCHGLTTLHRSFGGLGEVVGDIVLRAWRTSGFRCRGALAIEPRLIVRQSTAPLRPDASP